MLGTSEVSARELLDAHVERIEQVNPRLNAVVALNVEVGQQRAAAVDEAQARGDQLGSLAGLVTAHKDLADTADFPTTYGSPVFADHQPVADSLLVSRVKAEGGVAVGKTNTPEFGRGSNTFNPVYGVTVNPYDPARSCGGSSGGAAVALRTGMVAIADGSDMGGSLRNPAGWTNTVGFRASAGVVPYMPVGPPFPRLATDGAMGRSVDDMVMLLRVLSEQHLPDPLSRGLDLPDEITPIDRPIRVAFTPDFGNLPVEADVAGVIGQLPDLMTGMGWEVVEATPDFSGAADVFTTLRGWLNATTFAARLGDRFSEVKETIRNEAAAGGAVTPQQITDALTHLGVLWGRSAAFFSDFDILIGPVTQVSPFHIEVEYPMTVAGQEMNHYIEWMMSCCYVTAMGNPALSLPAGFTEAGLPVGMQIIGGPWQDLTVLRVAKTLEAATGHGLVQPAILG